MHIDPNRRLSRPVRSPDERQRNPGEAFPHIATLMRATACSRIAGGRSIAGKGCQFRDHFVQAVQGWHGRSAAADICSPVDNPFRASHRRRRVLRQASRPLSPDRQSHRSDGPTLDTPTHSVHFFITPSSSSNSRAPYGHAQEQSLQPMHSSGSTRTMPSSARL
jgi:hypothetical protein